MPCGRIVPVLLLLLAYPATGLAANLPQADSDGWYSWRVDVVDAAPELCCFSWNAGIATKKSCNLDGRHGGFDTTDEHPFPADEVQIYALMKSGAATKIRVLSSQCPVTTKSEITHLGSVPVDDSVGWLQEKVSPHSAISAEAIPAVALHAGDRARDFLVATARSDSSEDNREDAIFWMAQVRIDETAGELKKIILDDRSADIREHAAFSYSQSSASDRAAVLIQQGKADPDSDVRSQAWFWLAQIEAPESEAEIRKAIENDRDADVREQAVFALSQLPEDRAVKALADLLEDRDRNIEIRERALFWLAQTESDAAYEYVERLLTGN